MIGQSSINKSISGGEKKRLAFATEILSNPAILICDEPTSGLDSYMATNVVTTLKDIAALNRTVIVTIHQMYESLDRLMLLARGWTAYHGPAEFATDFFASCGFVIPDTYNPAEYFINKLAIVDGDARRSAARVKSICKNFAESKFSAMASEELHESYESSVSQHHVGHEYAATPWMEFRLLLWRSMAELYRKPEGFRSITTVLFVSLHSPISLNLV